MKILVWNIKQGGGPRKQRILERIQAHNPDVVVLVEFIGKTAGPFLESLSESGWTHTIASKPDGFNHHVCVLSKTVIGTRLSGIPVLDDSGLWLEVSLPGPDLGLGVVHVPTTERVKMRNYFNGLIEAANERKSTSFIFVGDFNTGSHPLDGNLRALGGVDQFEIMQSTGFCDVWRHFHGERSEPTFYWRGKGFRIDHALASETALARVTRCAYSHAEREEGVSDHSALLIETED